MHTKTLHFLMQCLCYTYLRNRLHLPQIYLFLPVIIYRKFK